MLTVNFLSVLPILKDGLAPFYEPIRKAIILAFETESLTPTKNGHHAKSTMLYRGSAKMSDVINNEDLTTLTGNQHDGWVVNAQQKNSREDVFLDDLQIDKFEFDELFEIFESLDTAIGILDEDEDTKDDYEEEINSYNEIKAWFEQKDDKWIKQFYNLLSEDEDNLWYQLNFPLVRINSVDAIKHVSGDSAYFESSIQENSENFENILTVKKTVYTKDKANKNIDENAVSFLKSIGVREFDERAIIEQKLIKYNSSYNPLINTFISRNYGDIQYFNDIKLFISYWKKIPVEIYLFKRLLILVGVSIDNKLLLSKPDDLYLDKPFVKTGLSEVQNIHRKIAVWGEYKNKLNKTELKDFVDFLLELEIMTELNVMEVRIRNNPNFSAWGNVRITDKCISEDYSIRGLESYLSIQSIGSSRLVWNALIRADKTHAKARWRPNAQHDIQEYDSQLIYHLKNHAWIPNKNGEFCKPQDMSLETLHDDFKFINSLAFDFLLKSIGFGENIKKRSEEYKQFDSLARKIGLDSGDEMRESAEFYKKMKSQGKVDKFNKLLDSEQPDFSEDSSSNPSRRAEKLKEDAINSPKKLKELRQRSVSDGEYEKVKQMAKEYLKDRYTINDVLYCQICRKEMPFKLSDGSYYFEAVSLINDTEKSYIYNFIALCPVDAAKFKYANTSRNNMKTLIKEIIENRTPEEINNNENGKNYIELLLAENSEVVEFTPKHLGDIKSTLDN
jgi:hypothetical protein